jgi:predicted MPP superfamily phosphohydrolase
MTIHKGRKRVITFSLVAACAFWIVPGWSQVGFPSFLLSFGTFMILFGSQVFWIGRVLDISERFIPGKHRRVWLGVVASVLYAFFFFSYNAAPLKMIFTGHVIHASDPRFYRAVIDGVFSVWLVGSFLGFVLVVFFWIVDRVARSAAWAYRYLPKAGRVGGMPDSDAVALRSCSRRRLLRQAAIAVSAAPFGAATYGLLHARLDLEITRRRIALARLPKAFEGFRIAQLSDLHISSFMSADQIRRCVTLTNQLKADLVVLTGDYVSWDPAAQGEVVQALAGLRAPKGVLGCLGNHEVITETEESITRLFAKNGIRILRQERAPVQLQGEMLNFIGVDDSQPGIMVIKHLVRPNTVNILLVHDASRADFDHAVEFGIDLTLMGHTHGGQLSLEFLHRGLCLARLETPYVRGWYEKSGRQLYVNRGIGTTAIPIRLGSRPEITVLELVRQVDTVSRNSRPSA